MRIETWMTCNNRKFRHTNYDPTKAQLCIYDFIEHGAGNGIIDAVAGAGVFRRVYMKIYTCYYPNIK